MADVLLLGLDTCGVVIYQRHRWWADHGLIHWENMDTGAYGSQTVRDTMRRLNALSDMVGKSIRDPGLAAHADAFRSHRKYVEDITALCQKAKAQGQPDDPQAVRHLVAAQRSTRSVVPQHGF